MFDLSLASVCDFRFPQQAVLVVCRLVSYTAALMCNCILLDKVCNWNISGTVKFWSPRGNWRPGEDTPSA